jgi:hypothetical protein
MSATPEEKLSNVIQFINLRENRHVLIGDYLDYENSIETVEGPAFYLELQAYTDISALTFNEGLKKYIKELTDKRESSYHLRKSCYISGLCICLLLAEINPNWKETFFNSNRLLFDILKEVVKWEYKEINDVEMSEETISIVKKIK